MAPPTTTEVIRPNDDPVIPAPSHSIIAQDPTSQGNLQVEVWHESRHAHMGLTSSVKELFLGFRDVERDSLEAEDITALYDALVSLGLDESLPVELRREAKERLATLISFKHHVEMAISYADRLATMAPTGVAKIDAKLGIKIQEKEALAKPRQILQEKIASDEALLEEIRQRIFVNQQALSSLIKHDSAIDDQIQGLTADKKKAICYHALERSAEEKSANYHLEILDLLWRRMRASIVAFAEQLPESP